MILILILILYKKSNPVDRFMIKMFTIQPLRIKRLKIKFDPTLKTSMCYTNIANIVNCRQEVLVSGKALRGD